ncbi:MAG: excalibur calcium-binding domain-containing protein [Acetobacteraceae bacterium]|nr:excalibur calcium-binding domain-containing protein [Acetobacteraceae bacterium]
MLMAGSLGVAVWELASRPVPFSLALRHQLAARSCSAARAVSLAPARIGEPGYWPHLDADRDGIACEPWPSVRGR